MNRKITSCWEICLLISYCLWHQTAFLIGSIHFFIRSLRLNCHWYSIKLNLIAQYYSIIILSSSANSSSSNPTKSLGTEQLFLNRTFLSISLLIYGLSQMNSLHFYTSSINFSLNFLFKSMSDSKYYWTFFAYSRSLSSVIALNPWISPSS